MIDTSGLPLPKPGAVKKPKPSIHVCRDGREICVQRKAWMKRRKEVWERDGKTCRGCAAPIPDLRDAHIHHIRHRSLGRDDRPENLLTLCLECHRKEHNQ